MHDDRRVVEDHIDRVLRERIQPAVYPETIPARISWWEVPDEPVPIAVARAATYTPTRSGARWGRPWGTTWIRVTGRIPDEWAGQPVEARIDLGFAGRTPGFSCEGMVYRPDGSPVKGLRPRDFWVRVGSPAAGGEAVELFVEAASNPVIMGDPPFRPTPLGAPATAGTTPLYRLGNVELARFDATVWELAHDVEVLLELMRELDLTDARRAEILCGVRRGMDAIDLGALAATAARARAVLAPLLAQPARSSAHRISAVGHAHIDCAWLWPIRETVRKVARTAANVTALMDDHPELVFAMSQAQQFAWLKRHRPEVFAVVARRIAEGRFVPVGGMWVESDTNMPGGEALARQFVHGKRFFAAEFGVETTEVWLPDSFGYSAALPQLIRLSGARWFLTQKISWNQTNRFPHHTFWWEGIDGTRVFTHFPPVDTYNAELSGRELAHAARNFAEKGRATRSLVPFGWGDGGGGPTRDMLARAARLRDLDGSPRVEIESPATFFAQAEAEYPDAPVWVGELYLEYHRGTYTSQARTKRGNRRAEHALREAELWAATAAVRHGAEYPYDALDRIWQTILLNQFHDILPGSSIAWVHRQAERDYAAATTELAEITSSAQRVLAGDGPGTVLFNAAPQEHEGVPALAAARPMPQDGEPVDVATTDSGFVLDNAVVRVSVDRHGLIDSIHDHDADREVIAPGCRANLLQLHPDLPNRWDAWDVDGFYRDTVSDLVEAREIRLVEADDRHATVEVRRSFGSSTVYQRLTVRAGARALEIDTEVDWHESEKILKLAFPLDVHADRSAAETQFGHVYRPTHTNTSWDAARFEICAHRWLHVAEHGYGVALANDATYGHDVTRSARVGGGVVTTVRASLLRAPRFPDPDTDHGTHRFRHVLAVGVDVAGAIREGYRINLPMREVSGSRAVTPLVTVDHPAVVEAVKLADDRSGDVIVRLYESLGGRARVDLTTGFTPREAMVTDLLERHRRHPVDQHHTTVAIVDNRVTLHLRPFEIVTMRLAR